MTLTMTTPGMQLVAAKLRGAHIEVVETSGALRVTTTAGRRWGVEELSGGDLLVTDPTGVRSRVGDHEEVVDRILQ